MSPSYLFANMSSMTPSDFLANLYEVHNSYHVFDKAATPEIIFLEVAIALFFIGSVLFLRRTQKHVFLKWAVGFVIFYFFQLFTASMFSTERLGPWAYIYINSSWITSLAYGTYVLWADFLANKKFPKYSIRNFLLASGIATVLTLLSELVMIKLGIRVFSAPLLAAFSGAAINLFYVYYCIIVSLILMAFYKYWNLAIDRVTIIPIKKISGISFITVFFAILAFDIMTETMVQNVGFPAWSYVYNDISVFLTLIGTVIVWTAITLVNRFLNYYDVLKKYVFNFLFAIAPVFALEVYFIKHGMRLYAQETIDNFSGLTIPVIYMPVEVFFGSMFYLAIVLPFASYIIFLVNQNTKKIK